MAYTHQNSSDHQAITLIELQVLAVNDAVGVRVNSGHLYNANNTVSPFFSGCLIG